MIEEIDVAKLIWEEEGDLQTNVDSVLLAKVNEIIRMINELQKKQERKENDKKN